MDKREAITLFLKEHSSVLLQDPFLKPDFKKIKREFFLYKLELPDRTPRYVPKDSEIATEAFEMLFRTNQISNKTDLNKYLKYPFFNRNIRKKDYWFSKLEALSKETKPLVDVNKLNDLEYKETTLKELEKEAYKRVMDKKSEEIYELDNLLEVKQNQLANFPSILDYSEFEIPESKETIEEILERIEYVSWWKKLNLASNPFRVLQGLSDVDKSLFDQILFKTFIFKKYEAIMDDSIEDLFQTVVVLGQFGSGKTTFLDFMVYKAYEKSLLPIYIQLGGEYDFRELTYLFKNELIDVLSRKYVQLNGKTFSTANLTTEDQIIFELLRSLSKKYYHGFVIIIDDLHKGELDNAMRFMNNLQIFISQFTRKIPHVRLGIFISGDVIWENILNEPKYSGSFSKMEYIPHLEKNDAYKAINQRLKAYSQNIENPRELSFEFIESIYNEIEYAGDFVTFRKLIRETLNELDSGNFRILSVDPFNIPKNVLEEIKQIYNKDIYVYSLFKSFRNNSKLNDSQRYHCIELLLNIYLRRGLPEINIVEEEKPYLQQLDRSRLISKYNRNGELIWNVSNNIYKLNKKIIDEYKLSLEDYLIKMYFSDIEVNEVTDIIIIPELESISDLIKKINNETIKDLLFSAKENHNELVKLDAKELYRKNPKSIIQKCTESLSNLTKAYFIYENQNIRLDSSNLDIIDLWKNYWWVPESLLHYKRALNVERDELKRELPHILNLYRIAFPEIVSFFLSEYENNNKIRIPLEDLNNDEIKLFHDCITLWNKNEYYDIANILSGYVERKLRISLFNIFSILYGNYDNRIKHLDVQSRGYVNNGINKKDAYTKSKNEFVYLNRGQYKNIMTGTKGSAEGRRNWNTIFRNIFQYSESDLYSYLNDFAEINVIASHNKDGVLNSEQQDVVYSFMQKSIRFLKCLNKAYQLLLNSDCYKLDHDNGLFSFCKFNDESELTFINISRPEIERFNEYIKDKEQIKIKISDQERIEAITGIEYRKLIAILTVLVNKDTYNIVDLDSKLIIEDIRGDEFYFNIFSN